MLNKRWRMLPLAGLMAFAVAACDNNPVALSEAASISASPESMSMIVGEESSVSAHVLDQNGNVLRGAAASWTSSEPSVASVTADGTVTARSAGQTTLTASYGGQAANVSVTVSPEAAALAMGQDDLRLIEGEFGQLTAQVVRADGTPIRNAAILWSTDDPNVARVQGSGTNATVMPRAPGTATVTARYGELTATTTVTVDRDDPRVVEVELLDDEVRLHERGDAMQIFYRAFDSRGRLVCGGETGVQVTSSDASVVHAWNGPQCSIWVDGLTGGTATVTVEIDDGSDTVEVEVSDDQFLLQWVNLPDAEEHFAGNSVSYSVRIVDQDDQPVAGHTVHFTVNRGRLSDTAVTTDDAGIATATWRLPTSLRNNWTDRDSDSGQIITRFEHPDGEGPVEGWASRTIEAGPAANITFWQRDNDTWEWNEVSSGSTTAETGTWAYFAASSYDEYGNMRQFRFIATDYDADEPVATGSGEWWTIDNRARHYRYFNSATEQTVTLTAYDRDQTFGAIDEDEHFSASLEIIFEDADDE
jgi:hypothetical protein